MNAEDQARILARVRKMMKLANDAGATEGERDNAMRMAHATLAKYNLDMAQIESEGGVNVGEERLRQEAEFYGRPWARTVVVAIAELFFCKYFYMPHSDAKRIRHVFIGRKSNVTTTSEMARFVVESIQREASREQRARGESSVWRRSFCVGASRSVYRRAYEMIAAANRASEATPGTAIVLASVYSQEKKANEEFLGDLTLRSGRSGKATGSARGAEAGARYGNSVSLSPQVRGAGQGKITHG